jgi:hypothetical protein
MSEIKLAGMLNLKGMLNFKSKVLVGGKEALVESLPPSDQPHSTGATPVILPPPPASPVETGTKVWVMNSFNKTVMANNKPIVAQGMAMQGGQQSPMPIWPGMVMPSQGNTGPVTINFIPINVVNDQAIIFPMGAPAPLTTSGQ